MFQSIRAFHIHTHINVLTRCGRRLLNTRQHKKHDFIAAGLLWNRLLLPLTWWRRRRAHTHADRAHEIVGRIAQQQKKMEKLNSRFMWCCRRGAAYTQNIIMLRRAKIIYGYYGHHCFAQPIYIFANICRYVSIDSRIYTSLLSVKWHEFKNWFLAVRWGCLENWQKYTQCT